VSTFLFHSYGSISLRMNDLVDFPFPSVVPLYVLRSVLLPRFAPRFPLHLVLFFFCDICFFFPPFGFQLKRVELFYRLVDSLTFVARPIL